MNEMVSKRGLLATWAGIGFIVLGSAGSTRADILTFYGLDPNTNENLRLDNHPMADAARRAFLDRLASEALDISDVETFASTPPRLTTASSGNLKATFTFPRGPSVTGRFVVGPQAEGYDFNVFVYGEPFTQPPPDFPATSAQTIGGRFSIDRANNYIEAELEFDVRFTVNQNGVEVPAPQQAIGFYATDIGDQFAPLTLTLSDGTASQPIPVPTGVSRFNAGSVLYFGVIDTEHPFTKVTFLGPRTGFDSFGFDNFTIARPGQVVDVVPEPNGLIPFGLGITGILVYDWRARARQSPHPRHLRRVPVSEP
jgi:hypothetical protein